MTPPPPLPSLRPPLCPPRHPPPSPSMRRGRLQHPVHPVRPVPGGVPDVQGRLIKRIKGRDVVRRLGLGQFSVGKGRRPREQDRPHSPMERKNEFMNIKEKGGRVIKYVYRLHNDVVQRRRQQRRTATHTATHTATRTRVSAVMWLLC